MVSQDESSYSVDVQLFAACMHDILTVPRHTEILEVTVHHLHAHPKESR